MKHYLPLLVPILISSSSCTTSFYKRISQQHEYPIFSEEWRANNLKKISSSSPIPVVSEKKSGLYKLFSWWEIYEDSALTMLEEIALENNPSLQIALHRFEASLSLLGIHESDFYPSLNLSADSNRKKIPKDLRTVLEVPKVTPDGISSSLESSPKRQNLLNSGLSVQYELDLWGRLQLIQKSYEALSEASLHDMYTVQLLITYQVAKLYYTIGYYNADIELMRTIEENIDNLLELTHKNYINGLQNLSSLLEIDSQKQSIQAEIVGLKKAREEAITALALLLGKEPYDFQIPNSTITWSASRPPATIPSQILSQRPDVQKSIQEMQALLYEIGIAEKEYLPRISLTALTGFSSPYMNHLFSWKNHLWSFGSTIGMNLLDGGRKKHFIEEKIANYKVKVEQHFLICLQALQEVENSLTFYATEEDRLKIYIAQDERHEQLRRLQEKRFEAGILPKQNVLLSDIDRLSSMRKKLQSQVELQLASCEIVKAIGGSWTQQQSTE